MFARLHRALAANPPLALMLLVFGIYLVTMSGHTYSRDEETMLGASRSLVERGSWTLPEDSTLVEVRGRNGAFYSQYGPGQSLAAVPWVGAALAVGRFLPAGESEFVLRGLLGTFNALVMAGMVGLLAALGLALGYSRRASLFVAGALAFSTFLWPHSRTFFSEPLVGLCLLGALYLLVAPTRLVGMRLLGARREGRERPGDTPDPGRGAPLHLRGGEGEVPVRDDPVRPHSTVGGLAVSGVLAGLLLALAAATKVQYIVVFPAYLVLSVMMPTAAPAEARRAWRLNYAQLASLLVGLVVGLLPLMAYDWAAFGSPFSTGYGADLRSFFRTPLLTGLYGLLLSPGKGLVWYAPPVILSIAGAWAFWRSHRAVTVFILLAAFPVVLLFSIYIYWHGDGSWGPRYLVPVVPILLIPGLAAVDRVVAWLRSGRRGTAWGAAGVSLVVASGFIVNLGGALENFDTYINMGTDAETRYYDPLASPVVGHLQLAAGRVQLHDWLLTALHPARTIVLRDGFSYSEGNRERRELLPRWTHGRGEVDIWPELSHGPVAVTLRLADHRPPPLPRAAVSILVNGTPVAAQAQPVAAVPENTDYTFAVASSPAHVTISTGTFNPSQIEKGGRNEELGIRLESISVQEGGGPASYNLVEALPAPDYYPKPRWYYDVDAQHPADLWFVYAAEARIGRKATLALGLPVLVVGVGSLLLGWLGLRRPRRAESED